MDKDAYKAQKFGTFAPAEGEVWDHDAIRTRLRPMLAALRASVSSQDVLIARHDIEGFCLALASHPPALRVPDAQREDSERLDWLFDHADKETWDSLFYADATDRRAGIDAAMRAP